VLLEASKQLSDTDRSLIQIFGSRLSVAFDNVILYEQLQQANASLEDRVRQRTRELVGANARLSAQWNRLQRANAFKSEVLGTVAHDLKNPLGVILGRTEMLTEMVSGAASSVDNIKAQIVHIRSAANRVTEIINSLISDAMADAHDITIRREPVDLVVLLRDLVEANQPLAARKEQTITLSAPATLDANCDSDRMREAVDNLLSNAIKYSPIGGRIEVGIDQRGDRTLIRVSDEGPGLSPEDTARLFGRFQRLSAKPTGGETSTGLGLSIVKRIVDLHGGTVMAETAGRAIGTTFMIAIPSA
jgi:signal transduction histidine kinase